MATKKYKKRPIRHRKTVRGHRSSTAGILPLLDVRNSKHLSDFERRIKKGPLTIIMVYADWCGHCHTMMPHFDAASKSSNRSIQSIKLNEQMLDSVNNHMKKNINTNVKPINVSGYPSIILVNNKGDKVSDIETVRDTEVMTNLMNKSGSLAKEASLNKNASLNKPGSKSLSLSNIGIMNNGLAESGLVESESPTMSLSKNENQSITKMNSLSKSKSLSKNKSLENEADYYTSLTTPVSGSVNMNMEEDLESTLPPSINSDIVQNKNNKIVGGNLLSALSKTTYALAPTAALLATAAYVMKGRNKHNKTARRHKKNRHTKKQRKYRK